jgi:hemerythrin-like domain-containing protein
MTVVRVGQRPPPSFDDPVGVLDACHRRIEDRLATLERALAALPAPEAVAAIGDVVRHFEGPVRRHMEDEEQSVLPRLDRAPELDALEAEHRTAEAVFLAFRTVAARLAAEPQADVGAELGLHAATLARIYRAHMQREEVTLFPRARALAPAELRAIGIEMRLRRGGGE